jgi:hypothetical protein
VGVNGLFKRKVAQLYKPENQNPKDFKNEVIQTIQSALHTAFSPDSIRNAFEESGIIPFNPKKVLSELVEGDDEVIQHFSTNKRKSPLKEMEGKLITSPEFLSKWKV